MNYFVIGDVHGKATMLENLLKKWDKKSQLIFLGDLIDRGEDSLSVLKRVKKLTEEGAICISGNHEYMFLSWLDNPQKYYDHYRRNGGDTTINSLLGRPLNASVDGIEDAQRIEIEAADLVAFIRQMPFVVETDTYIFVHAGLDLSLDNWRDTTNYQKVWIRQPFHQVHNSTGKTIIFGHTPTFYLNSENPSSSKIWQTKDCKIGIDGGAVYGGVLHGLLVGETGILQHHFIENDGFVAKD